VPARAQGREAFVEATLQFVQAADGEFGDEGRYLLAAADAMARALGEWDTALARSEAAMAADAAGLPPAEGARVSLALAVLHIERGRFERALAALDRAATLEPDGADAYLLKGLALDRLGREEAAAAAYHDAWRRAPRTLAAAYRVALAPAGTASLQADRAAAVAELVTATTHPESGRRFVVPTDALLDDSSAPAPLLPLARYAPAFALLGQGRYDEAVAALRVAAVADPLTRDASSDVVAAAGALRVGDSAGAIERLTAVTVSPSAPAEAHRVLAMAYRASGETAKALEELAHAVRLDPSDERARLAAAVLASAGRPADARLALLDAAQQSAPSIRARWQLGALAIASADWAAAVAALEPVAASRPLAGAGVVYGALARAYAARGDSGSAMRVLRARVEVMEHSSAAHAELAAALRASGRTEEAAVEELAAKLLR